MEILAVAAGGFALLLVASLALSGSDKPQAPPKSPSKQSPVAAADPKPEPAPKRKQVALPVPPRPECDWVAVRKGMAAEANGHWAESKELEAKARIHKARALGLEGEARVMAALNHREGPNLAFLHGLVLPSKTGSGMTQVDFAVINSNGVFAVEVKNMGGWIYGEKDKPKWTQTFQDGRKNPFNNPVLQNAFHVRAIDAAFERRFAASGYKGPRFPCRNVAAFVGTAVPKTEMPENVLWSVDELVHFLQRRTPGRRLLKPEEIAKLADILDAARLDRNDRM